MRDHSQNLKVGHRTTPNFKSETVGIFLKFKCGTPELLAMFQSGTPRLHHSLMKFFFLRLFSLFFSSLIFYFLNNIQNKCQLSLTKSNSQHYK